MGAKRDGAAIEYEVDGERLEAYLAAPQGRQGPGIVVVHDGSGLCDFVCETCDRLARADFVALAPDWSRGRAPAEGEPLRRVDGGADLDRVLDDLDGASIEVFNHHETLGSKVGIVGFGVGGALALASAAKNARVGAVVSFYGARADAKPDYSRLEAAVMAIFAEHDEDVSEPFIASLEADLGRDGVRASVQTRSGVRRGYLNPGQPDRYDAVAAERDWDQMLAFLRAELV